MTHSLSPRTMLVPLALLLLLGVAPCAAYSQDRPDVELLAGVTSLDTSDVVDEPAIGWVVGGTDPGESGRGAVRALSSVGSYALQVLIWAGILSPLWVPLSAVAFWLYRRRRAATA